MPKKSKSKKSLSTSENLFLVKPPKHYFLVDAFTAFHAIITGKRSFNDTKSLSYTSRDLAQEYPTKPQKPVQKFRKENSAVAISDEAVETQVPTRFYPFAWTYIDKSAWYFETSDGQIYSRSHGGRWYDGNTDEWNRLDEAKASELEAKYRHYYYLECRRTTNKEFRKLHHHLCDPEQQDESTTVAGGSGERGRARSTDLNRQLERSKTMGCLSSNRKRGNSAGAIFGLPSVSSVAQSMPNIYNEPIDTSDVISFSAAEENEVWKDNVVYNEPCNSTAQQEHQNLTAQQLESREEENDEVAKRKDSDIERRIVEHIRPTESMIMIKRTFDELSRHSSAAKDEEANSDFEDVQELGDVNEDSTDESTENSSTVTDSDGLSDYELTDRLKTLKESKRYDSDESKEPFTVHEDSKRFHRQNTVESTSSETVPKYLDMEFDNLDRLPMNEDNVEIHEKSPPIINQDEKQTVSSSDDEGIFENRNKYLEVELENDNMEIYVDNDSLLMESESCETEKLTEKRPHQNLNDNHDLPTTSTNVDSTERKIIFEKRNGNSSISVNQSTITPRVIDVKEKEKSRSLVTIQTYEESNPSSRLKSRSDQKRSSLPSPANSPPPIPNRRILTEPPPLPPKSEKILVANSREILTLVPPVPPKTLTREELEHTKEKRPRNSFPSNKAGVQSKPSHRDLYEEEKVTEWIDVKASKVNNPNIVPAEVHRDNNTNGFITPWDCSNNDSLRFNPDHQRYGWTTDNLPDRSRTNLNHDLHRQYLSEHDLNQGFQVCKAYPARVEPTGNNPQPNFNRVPVPFKRYGQDSYNTNRPAISENDTTPSTKSEFNPLTTPETNMFSRENTELFNPEPHVLHEAEGSEDYEIEVSNYVDGNKDRSGLFVKDHEEYTSEESDSEFIEPLSPVVEDFEESDEEFQPWTKARKSGRNQEPTSSGRSSEDEGGLFEPKAQYDADDSNSSECSTPEALLSTYVYDFEQAKMNEPHDEMPGESSNVIIIPTSLENFEDELARRQDSNSHNRRDRNSKTETFASQKADDEEQYEEGHPAYYLRV